MNLFSFISLCIIPIFNSLQLKMTSHPYQNNGINDQDYQITLNIDGINYQFLLDTSQPYTWIYSKNPVDNSECQNCPQNIQIFQCRENCIKEQTSTIITLSNQNQCLLTSNKLVLDNYTFDKFQLCLSYKNINIENKLNGIFSLQKFDLQSEQKFSIFSDLKQSNIPNIFTIVTAKDQEILFLGESNQYFVQNQKLYQNQDKTKWKLQYQIQYKESYIISKQDNLFIEFDLRTKYFWFPKTIIDKLIQQIQNIKNLSCQVQQLQLVCLCSSLEKTNQIPHITISFNGQDIKYDIFDIIYSNNQQCYLNVFQHESKTIIGNQFFKKYGATFKNQENEIWIGQTYLDNLETLHFSNLALICILCSILFIIGIIALILILKQISQNDLNIKKYKQDPEQPLYVLSKTQHFKPRDLALSTQNQLEYYQRRF